MVMLYANIRGNWVRGIWKLLLCQFCLNLKLFQNKNYFLSKNEADELSVRVPIMSA